MLKLQDSALFSSEHAHSPYAHNEFPGVFIRAPGILELNSPSVQPLATIEGRDSTVVAVRQGHLMATCFHPELTPDPRWHAYFLDMVVNRKYPQE